MPVNMFCTKRNSFVFIPLFFNVNIFSLSPLQKKNITKLVRIYIHTHTRNIETFINQRGKESLITLEAYEYKKIKTKKIY